MACRGSTANVVVGESVNGRVSACVFGWFFLDRSLEFMPFLSGGSNSKLIPIQSNPIGYIHFVLGILRSLADNHGMALAAQTVLKDQQRFY